MIAILIVLCAALGGLAYLAAHQAARLRSTDALLRERLLETVVVEIKTGETFRGLLAACDDRSVVLRNAEAITSATASAVLVDGDLILNRSDVKWFQRP